METIEEWDFVAIVVYFAAVIAVGIISMCRKNRGTVTGYFLAGRHMTWLPIGASLFASNIGSEHFIGLAGSGAASGIAVGAFEFNAIFMLLLLGWVFLPVYISSGVHTLPEYISKRFGGRRIRVYLSCLSLFLYIVTKISVNLYSGGLFIKAAMNWDLFVSVAVILLLTGFCTITGGLAAVIYMDTLQAFVMVTGATILSILGFIKVGGIASMYEKYMVAVATNTSMRSNSTCGYPREDSFIMLRDAISSDMPWPGFILGQTVASIWYWCADQMMVQRALAAKSLSHAKGAAIFTGYIKMTLLFIMVMPGMISRVLYPDIIACTDPDECFKHCGSRVACTNLAYPKLVLGVMPTGLKGLMVAVMLAALMSDLTSIFNSAATLFTIDIYQSIRKKPSVRELMVVGRVCVAAMILISLLWIPIVQEMQGGQLYIYIQTIAAYVSPPIACVYVIGILWKRANEKGCFWAIVASLLVGGARFILDIIYRSPECGEVDDRPVFLSQIHYMYFALILFIFTAVVMISVSLLTSPLPAYRSIRTLYRTRHDKAERVDEDTDSTSEVEANDDDEEETMFSTTSTNEEILRANGIRRTTERSTIKTAVKRVGSLFCGLEEEKSESELKRIDREANAKRITSLEQNPKAVVLLNFNLVLISSLCVAAFVFFSIPLETRGGVL